MRSPGRHLKKRRGSPVFVAFRFNLLLIFTMKLRLLFVWLGCLFAAVANAQENMPTLHLVGDSTMATKRKDPPNPETGWGQALESLLKSEAVKIANHAVNGRSTKSFIDEGRWGKVVAALQPGDFVIVQFGHNDSKMEDPKRFAAPRGAYQDNLRRFIQETRDRGATPILATPVARRRWSPQGELVETHGDYPAAVREVALQEKVALLELNSLTMELERAHGVEGSKRLHLFYPGGMFDRWPEAVADGTHYSEYGAGRVAALVVQEWLRLQLPSAQWLR